MGSARSTRGARLHKLALVLFGAISAIASPVPLKGNGAGSHTTPSLNSTQNMIAAQHFADAMSNTKAAEVGAFIPLNLAGSEPGEQTGVTVRGMPSTGQVSMQLKLNNKGQQTLYYTMSGTADFDGVKEAAELKRKPDGSFEFVSVKQNHGVGGRVELPPNSETTIPFTRAMMSARLNLDESPTATAAVEQRASFVEFSLDGGVTVNLSFVDWISLGIGMKLTSTSGAVQSVAGSDSDDLDKICTGLEAQTAIDGQPWDKLCIKNAATGRVVRINSPNVYLSYNPTSSLANYYDPYVNEVWVKYATEDLVLDKSANGGQPVTCRVTNDVLQCNDAARISFVKPTTKDIFACVGKPFDNKLPILRERAVPVLCAALQRSTLLLPAALTADPSTFYQADITNHYARLVHENIRNGIGYAFPYDDVASGGVDWSGTLSDPSPATWEVEVR